MCEEKREREEEKRTKRLAEKHKNDRGREKGECVYAKEREKRRRE